MTDCFCLQYLQQSMWRLSFFSSGIWATARQNQQNDTEDSDRPARAATKSDQSLRRALSKDPRFFMGLAKTDKTWKMDAQANLSFRWTHG